MVDEKTDTGLMNIAAGVVSERLDTAARYHTPKHRHTIIQASLWAYLSDRPAPAAGNHYYHDAYRRSAHPLVASASDKEGYWVRNMAGMTSTGTPEERFAMGFLPSEIYDMSINPTVSVQSRSSLHERILRIATWVAMWGDEEQKADARLALHKLTAFDPEVRFIYSNHFPTEFVPFSTWDVGLEELTNADLPSAEMMPIPPSYLPWYSYEALKEKLVASRSSPELKWISMLVVLLKAKRGEDNIPEVDQIHSDLALSYVLSLERGKKGSRIPYGEYAKALPLLSSEAFLAWAKRVEGARVALTLFRNEPNPPKELVAIYKKAVAKLSDKSLRINILPYARVPLEIRYFSKRMSPRTLYAILAEAPWALMDKVIEEQKHFKVRLLELADDPRYIGRLGQVFTEDGIKGYSARHTSYVVDHTDSIKKKLMISREPKERLTHIQEHRHKVGESHFAREYRALVSKELGHHALFLLYVMSQGGGDPHGLIKSAVRGVAGAASSTFFQYLERFPKHLIKED